MRKTTQRLASNLIPAGLNHRCGQQYPQAMSPCPSQETNKIKQENTNMGSSHMERHTVEYSDMKNKTIIISNNFISTIKSLYYIYIYTYKA